MFETVRGLVYDRFPSVREFAKAMGWNHNKAAQIVNGEQEPRVTELQQMAVVLNVSVEQLSRIFLRK